MAKARRSLDGATLRFHFDEGPMNDKDYDQRTTSDGELVPICDACYVGSYLGSTGYTLTTAMNLASGKLVAFASNGKEWVQQSGRSSGWPKPRQK